MCDSLYCDICFIQIFIFLPYSGTKPALSLRPACISYSYNLSICRVPPVLLPSITSFISPFHPSFFFSKPLLSLQSAYHFPFVYKTLHFSELISASLVAQMVKNRLAMQVTWVGMTPWRRKWQSTPVVLPGEAHGQRSLVGYSPCSCKELDMTENSYLMSPPPQ